MARLDAVRDATRPKMHGRVMLSGPSGAGKTWTSLSMATRLAADDERPGEILVIDTEKESALTYADSFTFKHLPWRPPYDPDELANVLGQLGETYSVVQVDSFSHFWRGPGGTLSIADGKFGGWKNARPVQERAVEAVLAMPCHVILCVRSKMDYLVTQDSSKKQEITKVGLAPIQDEDLVYEMNVAMDIDLEHRITVTKSRSAAVPVGRMYPAGMEGKAADDYASWLAGGVPPAAKEDVDGITAQFASIVDAELRKTIKAEFVQTFGMPATLTVDKVTDAKAWVAARVDGNDEGSESDTGTDRAAENTGEAPGADTGGDAPDAGDGNVGVDPGNPEGLPHPAFNGFKSLAEIIEHVKPMSRATILAELTALELPLKPEDQKDTKLDTLRRRLAEEMARRLNLLPDQEPPAADGADGGDGRLGV